MKLIARPHSTRRPIEPPPEVYLQQDESGVSVWISYPIRGRMKTLAAIISLRDDLVPVVESDFSPPNVPPGAEASEQSILRNVCKALGAENVGELPDRMRELLAAERVSSRSEIERLKRMNADFIAANRQLIADAEEAESQLADMTKARDAAVEAAKSAQPQSPALGVPVEVCLPFYEPFRRWANESKGVVSFTQSDVRAFLDAVEAVKSASSTGSEAADDAPATLAKIIPSPSPDHAQCVEVREGEQIPQGVLVKLVIPDVSDCATCTARSKAESEKMARAKFTISGKGQCPECGREESVLTWEDDQSCCHVAEPSEEQGGEITTAGFKGTAVAAELLGMNTAPAERLGEGPREEKRQ